VRRARPDFPGDPRHAVEEPTEAAIGEALLSHGIEGEVGTWRDALSASR